MATSLFYTPEIKLLSQEIDKNKARRGYDGPDKHRFNLLQAKYQRLAICTAQYY
jgi:hypothetical protein